MVLRASDAFDNLKAHMLEVVSQARDRFGLCIQSGTDDGNNGAGLLRNMVGANMTFEGEAGYKSLTDGELLSNMFVSRLIFLDTLHC